MNRPKKLSLFAGIALTGTFALFLLVVSPVLSSALQDFLVFSPIIYRPAVPTVPPPIVKNVGNETNYVSSGDLHIVGDIYNATSNHTTSLYVPIRLLDSNNQVIDSENAGVFLSNLSPNDTTCYSAAFLNRTTGWSKIEIFAPEYDTTSNEPPKLSISSLSGAYNAQTGNYTINGSIKNDDHVTVYNVKAIGTLYDKNEKVVGCMAAYVDGALNLLMGRTANFKITFYDRDYKDVTRFRLQTDGFIQ